jgi:hypothetical protein
MGTRKTKGLLSPKIARLLAVAAAFPAVLAVPARGQCQRAKLTGDDGAAGDRFGFSVGLGNDIAMAGAPWHDHDYDTSGGVYVFERFGAEWLNTAEFALPEGQGLGAGWHLAFDGETAIVGSTGWPRVYERSGDEWVQMAMLQPGDHETGDGFGEALAIDSDLAIVGAPRDNDNGWRSGSAYVFERDPNGVWTQAAKFLADDGGSYDNFGSAVAIDGDVAVIGAPDDNDLGDWSGSAYVFERDPNGVWSQGAKLLPHDGSSFWNFGDSVAVSGCRVLVGATTAFAFAPNGGAAYVFERDGTRAWTEVAQLVSDDIGNSDFFGIAVALEGDIALIGAENADHNAADSGAAYVFVREPDGTWPQVAKIGAADGAYDDRFGSSLALSANTAVIGAYYDDDHGQDSGSAYVFAVGPDEDGDGIMDVCLCPGDLDHDLDVDLSDLAQLLSNYGETSGMTYEDGDLDEDGDVDLFDLSALLGEYGTICP